MAAGRELCIIQKTRELEAKVNGFSSQQLMEALGLHNTDTDDEPETITKDNGKNSKPTTSKNNNAE